MIKNKVTTKKKNDKTSFINKIKNNMQLSREINDLINSWKQVMYNTGSFNKMLDTFEIIDTKKEGFGWSFKLFASWGLTFSKLNELQDIIEDNLKCYFIFKIHDNRQYCECKIVYPSLVKVNDIKFKPYKVKPYECFLGVAVDNSPIIADMNIVPHILIAGGTRKGKNGTLNHILISLIDSCTKDEFQLYYYQAAKQDGLIYKNCEQTYAFASNNLYALLEMTKHLIDEMNRRSKLFEYMCENFLGDNLLKYNKLNKSNQLPYIYLVIDEFLAVNPDTSDDKTIKDLKNKIMHNIAEIGQYGGALGVTYIISHQKPEKALMPTFLKNMSNVRVCFGFKDLSCSQIVLGTDEAVGLPPRRAYFDTSTESGLLYTMNLEDKTKGEYLKPTHKKHRTLWDDLEKLNRNNSKKDKKEDEDNSEDKDSNEKNSTGKVNVELERQINSKLEELNQKLKTISLLEETLKKEVLVTKENTKSNRNKYLNVSEMFANVDPGVNEAYINNISKINNFVPYMPIDNAVTVIDKTTIINAELEYKPLPKTGKCKIK